MKKTIIILAKSFKRKNYCIAGIDRDTGEWIRLVSDDVESEGAVLQADTVLSNGQNVQVLDIVEVDLIRPVPTNAQRENWLYNRKVKWVKVGTSTLQQVIDHRGTDDCGNNIFGNTEKKIHPENVTGQSLALIKVNNPYIVVKTFKDNEKKNLGFCFRYNNISYSFFSVSDIPLYTEYKQKNDATYKDFGNSCYVVVSLTGAFTDGLHYKMLAQLFRD